LRTIGSAISGRGHQGGIRREQRRPFEGDVPAQGADVQRAVRVLAVVVEAGESVDVDEQVGRGEP
jgi:hypothetical protein